MYQYKFYEKKLSRSIQTLMYQVMKNATQVTEGFMIFTHRTIIKAHLDIEECDKVLKAMVINKENVLRYLKRKYIPTYNEKGAIFKNQSCIQAVKVMPDKTLYVHIKNSEPHKIITDTLHVMKLLKEKGFEFIPEIKYYIEQVKISIQDTRTYNMCIEEFGFKVPSASRIYERQLKTKYGTLEQIARVKMRSIKRKFLRYHVKRRTLTWAQLRKLLNMSGDQFKESYIKKLCKEIREENLANGIKVDY